MEPISRLNCTGEVNGKRCIYAETPRCYHPCSSCTRNQELVFDQFDPEPVAKPDEFKNIFKQCLLWSTKYRDRIRVSDPSYVYEHPREYAICSLAQSPHNVFMPAPILIPSDIDQYELIFRCRNNQIRNYKHIEDLPHLWPTVKQYMIIDHSVFKND